MDEVFRKAGRPRKVEKPSEPVVEAVATPVSTPERPAMRPPLREDPRERAAKRAAEIRGHLNGTGEGIDEFEFDRSIVPEGWDYEWKRLRVMGAEDPAYQVNLRLKGWEPVEASRHPEMMPLGSKDVHITRKDMILMERPLELSEESRNAELRRARLQVKAKEEQLTAAPAGTFERNNKDASLAKVKKGYEAMPIVDK
jgi:hypothetical protein